MSIKSALSNVGIYALGAIALLAVTIIPAIFIYGGVYVGEKILPWLMFLSMLALGFCFMILLPLTIFSTTRPWAALGFVYASFLFGATGWFMGLLLTWILWGGIAVLIGVCVFGVGVVPMAILATLFKGMWLEFGLLVLAVILTFGLRILGAILVEKADAESQRTLSKLKEEETGYTLTNRPKQTSRMLFECLRWVFVLPAAVAGYFAIQVAVGFGGFLFQRIPALGNDMVCQFINSILGPVCFVLAGAKTAPKHHLIVAICLTVTFATASIIFVAMGYLITAGHSIYPLSWLIVTSLVGISAAVVCCLSLRGRA